MRGVRGWGTAGVLMCVVGCTGSSVRVDCEAMFGRMVDLGLEAAGQAHDAEIDLEASKRKLREKLPPAEAQDAISMVEAHDAERRSQRVAQVRAEMMARRGEWLAGCERELAELGDRRAVVECVVGARDVEAFRACGVLGF